MEHDKLQPKKQTPITCTRCGSNNIKRNGSSRGALRWHCKDCGKYGTSRPESGSIIVPPDGYFVKEYVSRVDSEGNIKDQWIRNTIDLERQREMMLAAVEAMCRDLPRVKPVRESGKYRDNLLTAYPMGDPHFGMLSYPGETGQKWNLELARTIHCRAVDDLVSAAPNSSDALIVNLGDAIHYDSLESKTPRSGHIVDSDSRYGHVIDVAITALRYCIDSALRKHKIVNVICAPGNHDETGGMWLERVLSIAYEREKRVNVIPCQGVFGYFRYSDVLLGVHHGHTTKPANLPAVMAADRARDWGETRHRHWLTGHVHHESKKEFPGCTVESFNTLASMDAYAYSGGWRSGRTMQSVVYHAQHGEVARSKVNVGMYGE